MSATVTDLTTMPLTSGDHRTKYMHEDPRLIANSSDTGTLWERVTA